MNDTTIITNSPIGQHLDAIGESKPASYLMFNKKKIELVAKITIGTPPVKPWKLGVLEVRDRKDRPRAKLVTGAKS